jgi:DNA-binding CsgD family transcriptional regulator
MTTVAIPAEDLKHGDYRLYWRGCRCTPCSKNASARSARNKLLRTTGRGDIVQPDRAARHIHTLRAAGMSDREIIRLADITISTFYKVASLKGGIRRRIEQQILAVPAQPRPTVENCSRIDGTGTRRRLQALIAAGWPCNALATRLGMDDKYTHEVLTADSALVKRRTAVQIQRLFADLFDQQPEAHGVRPASALRARRLAARRHWHPAGAWDDIDNPNEQPQYGARVNRSAAIVEDVAELVTQGHSRDAIAERLGVTWNYVQIAHSREGIPMPEVTR